MDWTRVELLHKNSIATVARYLPSAGNDDPTWDLDNDLSFSDNGVRLTFSQPITDYAWIEITLVNVDVPATVNPRISVLAFPTSGGIAVGAGTTGNVPVAAFSEFVLKIPVLQQIEELAFQPVFPFNGKRVAIKKIQLLQADVKFEKVKNAARMTVNMPGFVYDPVLDAWTSTILSQGQSVGNFTVTPLANGVEWLVMRVSTQYNTPSPLCTFQWENNQSYGGESGLVEVAFSGDLLANPMPKSLTIFNVDGFQSSKVKLEFFIGRFQENVSAFGNLTQASTPTAPVFNPYAINFLNQNNAWNGINTFNNLAIFNAGIQFFSVDGWLRVVGNNIISVPTIPVGSITGLGTMAFQNANGVTVSGGTINATAIGPVTPSTGAFTNVTALNYKATGAFDGGLGVTFGFYTAINSASNTYQMILNGTADSFMGGSFGFGDYTPLVTGAIISITRTHAATGTSGYGVLSSLIGPSTMTAGLTGFSSTLQTSAAGYTVATIAHFQAGSTIKGAGSSITNNFGFIASSTLAVVGAANYGFYGQLASGVNSFNFFGAGTAANYFGGNVSIGQGSADASNAQGSFLTIGLTGTHPSALTGIFGVKVDYTVPATATVLASSYDGILRTVNSAFVLPDGVIFHARATSKGAASTWTRVYGFFASNGIVVGTNNYGFYSDINSAANTYQLNMAGTASSVFQGPISILLQVTNNDVLLRFGQNGTVHPNTGTSSYVEYIDITVPSTSTSLFYGVATNLRTAAVAFTVANINHFVALVSTLGAGSAATNIRGFYASNNIAVGSNNYGFYSDINTATNTYQFYAAGTAVSAFFGQIGIMTNVPGDGIVTINGGTHPSILSTAYIYFTNMTLPVSATTAFSGIHQQFSTANTAVTYTDLSFFKAVTIAKGAASTITSVRGFYAMNAIAVGTNNYGFYSDINTATNYAFYGAGTASSFFGGVISIGSAVNTAVMVNVSGTHPSAATTIFSHNASQIAPSSATVSFQSFRSAAGTIAAAFTLAELIHFYALGQAKGAGSTITNAYGFYASNTMVQGATTFGFYSNIAFATNTYQLYMAGSAPSVFAGSLIMSAAPIISARVTETYSASITSVATSGDTRVITVTNGVAFTINNPTNPQTGQRLLYIIRNTSGGAMGAITWGANMKVAGWVNPATAFSRSIEFEYDGTNWVTIDVMTADVPN